MVFLLMSWLMHTGREGNYFVSDLALVTEDDCEVLTAIPQHVRVVKVYMQFYRHCFVNT
jgi:hypothetical protein